MLVIKYSLQVGNKLNYHPIAKQKARRSADVRRLAGLVGLCALAAAWHWLAPDRWLDFEVLTAWQRSFQTHPLAPFVVIAAYVLGGIVLFPVTVLTAATIVTFGPVTGNLYSLGGWLVSASLGFCVGRHVGLDWLGSLIGERFERLRDAAARRGLLAVLALRLVPVAPFTIVNLFIGASRICFAHFIAGSILGRIPGILLFTLFAVELQALSHSISVGRTLLVAVALGLIFLAQRWISRQLAAQRALAVGETDLN
jgi:phospholipase D1/2